MKKPEKVPSMVEADSESLKKSIKHSTRLQTAAQSIPTVIEKESSDDASISFSLQKGYEQKIYVDLDALFITSIIIHLKLTLFIDRKIK